MSIIRACIKLLVVLCALTLIPLRLIDEDFGFLQVVDRHLDDAYSILDNSLRARESSEVQLRRTDLMVNVMGWLAASSFNNSAASISAQAISAQV